LADFEPAFKETMKHEGGYANDPHDHGGETYRGISRKNWRGWDGWPQIDRIVGALVAAAALDDDPDRVRQTAFLHEINAALDKNPDLQGRVREFYKRNFWMPVMQDVQNQELANWIFDKGVNMGVSRAYKLLQRALHVDQDGVIGPQTRAMLNAADPVKLLADCREEAKRFYTQLALKDPSQSRFLHGWLARA
jgi:lysozyme family protein